MNIENFKLRSEIWRLLVAAVSKMLCRSERETMIFSKSDINRNEPTIADSWRSFTNSAT
jgi:hypothetical protein